MVQKTIGTKKKIGQILVELKLLSKEQLQSALKYQASHPEKRIGEILIDKGIIDSSQLITALSRQFRYPVVDLTKVAPKIELLNKIPKAMCEEYNILPLGEDKNSIIVCLCDPLDLVAIENIKFALNTDIKCVLAPREMIRKAIGHFYSGAKGKLKDTIMEAATQQDEIDSSKTRTDVDLSKVRSDDDAPIIRFVQQMIETASKDRASDIHVEPMEDRVVIRFRIDGVLRQANIVPKRLQGSLLSRLKIMADMDIAEKRKPQDGRIKITVSDRELDIRVSSIPSMHGESIVMRLLDKKAGLLSLEQLGFDAEDYKRFSRLIKRPNGIILITGPTGSGKTTTLYAVLSELNRPDVKIITAENPVEYNIAGLNQANVRHNIGLTFGKILRAMLRQAPDIILVGEIRDIETAEIAIQSALTGHLVFSTLHTNDAPGALTRLLDMGIKPFLVASSIQAVMGQRLIRVLCTKCKKKVKNPSPSLLRALNISQEQVQTATIFEPVGCNDCNNTGYRGRKGIFELMEVDSEMREMVFRREPLAKIRAHAKMRGMVTLMEDGVKKILNGTTSLNEILAVTRREDISY